MTNAIHTETLTLGKRTYTINLYHDQDCESPLANEDGVFLTYTRGARCEYGNTPLNDDEHALIRRRIELFGDKAAQLAEALCVKDDDEWPLGEPLIGIAVHFYEHGPQVSMRSSHGFDDDHRGFAYVTSKTALEWHGGERLTEAQVEQTYKNLEAIVEEFGRWCNGECYYYSIEDASGERIDDLCCGGFIGDEYAMNEARDAVKWHHKWITEQARKESRERTYWHNRGVMTV